MTKPILKLYPSAPLEKYDLEQKLKTKLNDLNSFITSIMNNKEMIKYFKDKIHKSKKIYKNYQRLTLILESVDTVVII